MKTLALLLSVVSLAACAVPVTSSVETTVNTTPVAGFVTDRASFDAFIATAPTPDQFRARYPDVTLALPGSINTKEMRSNNSRYFAELDAAGRIVGGKFQ